MEKSYIREDENAGRKEGESTAPAEQIVISRRCRSVHEENIAGHGEGGFRSVT